MAKWPNVPDCCGWLGLDARGDWYMRDAAAQALGPFPASKGSRLTHDKLIAFIARNYAADAQGRWFFQNGPQRVFVELECTPIVARLTPDLKVWSHTGVAFDAQEAWIDEEGLLYLADPVCVARVHTQDMMLAVDWLDARHIQPQTTRAAELPLQYHFVRHPTVGC
jgi:hypothetical protein